MTTRMKKNTKYKSNVMTLQKWHVYDIQTYFLFIDNVWLNILFTCCRRPSRQSLSCNESPSFCSLRISSGFLYGLRASKCITLSLKGRWETVVEWVAVFFFIVFAIFTGVGRFLNGTASEIPGAGFRTWTFLTAGRKVKSWYVYIRYAFYPLTK